MTDLRKFRELARNWEVLGDVDPMFGVLSDPSKHGGRWDPEEFFASGRAHVENLIRALADARATFVAGACLDFGCGVGRLTIPLAERFRQTVGVDVAQPMIETARRFRPRAAACEFVVNPHPDLRGFETGRFDVVHSCLVLQHIPPDVSRRYIAEFFRVSRIGGLVVFQVPAEAFSAAQLSAAHALPDTAYTAALTLADVPQVMDASASATLVVRATNLSVVTWRHDIPAGRRICVGNHWLRDDGTRVVDDDARGVLPRSVEPGDTVEVELRVQAPSEAGLYQLEVDLVQEHVCWFAERGSTTVRTPVRVGSGVPREPSRTRATVIEPPTVSTPKPAPAPSFVKRLLRRWRGGTPTFEMHVVPRADVERTIAESGGVLLRAVDDNAAGPGWLSYTYICRNTRSTSVV